MPRLAPLEEPWVTIVREAPCVPFVVTLDGQSGMMEVAYGAYLFPVLLAREKG